MKLDPDEEIALKALLGLGLSETTIRRALLDQRERKLTGERDRLLAELGLMDNESASQAFEVLANAYEQLADDLEETL